MSLSTEQRNHLAEELWQAEKNKTAITNFSSRYPQMNHEDAYAIQFVNSSQVIKSGKRHIGYKVGLTSREAQKHFKVFEPDFGMLYDSMVVPNEGEISLKTLMQPKIEGEIAFVLKKDLEGPGITAVDVLGAIDYALATMEVVDSRFADWKITSVDTISDNGSSALVVLSNEKKLIENLNFSEMGMAFSRNGEVILSGSGAAVLGGPVQSVVFLANELGRHGRKLLAGELVLTGSISGMVAMKPNEAYRCEISKLGTVNVRIKP